MAKRQAPADEPNDESAKRIQVYLDPDLARKGRVIAASLGVTLPDYVNARLRPIIERELDERLDDLGYSPKK